MVGFGSSFIYSGYQSFYQIGDWQSVFFPLSVAHFFILLITVFPTSVVFEVQLINFFSHGLYLSCCIQDPVPDPQPPKFPPVLCPSTPSLLSTALRCLPGFGNHHCSACHRSSGQLLAEVGRARSSSATSGERPAAGPGVSVCLSVHSPSALRF